MNCVAAVLLFPAGSVNLFPATSMVVAPAPDGVNVAVYTVDETAAKLLNEPPVTVISFAAKPVAASLAVNLNAIVESLVVDPLVTPEVVDVMAIVGLSVSTTVKLLDAVLRFPAAS